MGQRRRVDERRCLRRTAPPSTTAQRSPGRGSGALFVYEEVLVHFLQVQSFINPNTDIVPDHQSCELLSIDEHDSERVTLGGLRKYEVVTNTPLFAFAGHIRDCLWWPDGKTLPVLHVQFSADVVLLRDSKP